MKLNQLIVMAVAIAGASACSGGNREAPQQGASPPAPTAQAASSARITHPCKLLTRTEASAAIGAELAPGEENTSGIVTRCAFSNRERQSQLWLDVQNATAPVSDASLFDALSHEPDAKLLSGIGDKALWSHSRISTFLYILKGGNMVAMGLPRTMATLTPSVEQAGKLVASRM